DAAHAPRGRIVHDAAEHDAVGEFRWSDPVCDPERERRVWSGGRGANVLPRAARPPRPLAHARGDKRPKRRIPHPQWLEHFATRELVQRHTADATHDLAEDLEVDVGVAEDVAGAVPWHLQRGAADSFLVSAPR